MAITPLDKYNPAAIEPKLQQEWEKQGIYYWHETEKREESFVIDTPPPTVSGTLHMGHIFSYTQADFIARFRRMYGFNVFYPMGFDDNGLPTERLVEKVKKVKASQLPRSEFISLCQEVVADAEEDFRKLFRSIALSVDWRQEYQTISPQVTQLSQMSFIDLYRKGYLYRNMQPSLWDSADRTALAQADIVDRELPSAMIDIIFTDQVGKNYVIATTRPEMLPACVAVLYHPEDKRFAHLAGQKLYTPLFHVGVPCIADNKVDPEKGSGLVMCCTFGDTTDVEWWRRHQLPLRIIIDRNGCIDDSNLRAELEWPAKTRDQAFEYLSNLVGKPVKAARSAMIELLEQHNLVVGKQEITHMVKCAERSGMPLEILITPQWNIKLLEHKEELLAQAKKCRFYPEYMQVRLEQWIEGLQWDWCISRQRYFGVPFPVWYSKRAGEEGKILIAEPSQLPVDPINDLPLGYSREELEPDYDVMDTWATSSITPQLNSHGIGAELSINPTRHKALFPADLRPQAHEIIRTWAFYTLVKAYYHEATIPWHELMISGWCLAEDKTKMSKSKGNIVDPVDLIKAEGADTIRYWASNSRLGADIAYSGEVFKLGKKLQNKLWNASKFVSTHFVHLPEKVQELSELEITHTFDKWLLHKLHYVVEKATSYLLEHEYCAAKMIIEEFFWKDFCDNYLELTKVRAYNQEGVFSQAEQLSVVYTLYNTLNILLHLFAPIMPHITEEIYTHLYPGKGSLHAQGSWPKAQLVPVSEIDYNAGEIGVAVLESIRKVKSEHNLSPKACLAEVRYHGAEQVTSQLEMVMVDLGNAMSVTKFNLSTNPLPIAITGYDLSIEVIL